MVDGKVTYPAKPSASFLLYFFQVKWMLDLLRSRLWLTCSCPFLSLAFANCWNAGYLWLGVPCQQGKEGPGPLPMNFSLSDLPSLPRRLRTLSTLPNSPKARQVKERWILLLPGSKAALLLLSVHGVKEKPLGLVQKPIFGWKRQALAPEPLGFWMSM